MPSMIDIHERQAQYVDRMLAAFTSHLEAQIRMAETSLIAVLQKKLSITDGVIDQTPGNLRVLRNLDALFMAELERAGYSQLLKAFVGEFNGQLPFLREIVGELSAGLPKWTATDIKIMAGMQATSIEGIKAAVLSAASNARGRLMFSVAGLSFKKTVETIKEAFQTTAARAASLSETSMMLYFRTATDLQFQHIEDTDTKRQYKYRYWGPRDIKTRPFCDHVLALTNNEGMTREQIAELDNGQIPNCMVSNGGWRCRHVWLLDTRDIEKRLLRVA